MQKFEDLLKFWSVKEPVWDIPNCMSECGAQKKE